MNGDGSFTIKWPDEDRRFRLGIGELRELQDKCDAGPAQIAKALGDGTWRIEYVREVIRIGLIGGGLDSQKALGLVGRYLVPGKYMACAQIAAAVIFAALVGDEAEGESLGKTEAETPSESVSRPYTEAVPSLDGPRAKSTNAHSMSSPPQ